MLPHFPRFSKLELKHKTPIEKITHQFPPYSDFNFTSLWTYNTDDSIEVSSLNGNLVVRFTDYISLKPFLSFIGKKDIHQTAQTLITYSNQVQLEPYLKLVPESVILATPTLTKDFDVVEDHDNHDYIVSAIDITHLPEEKYKRKKYLVERFKNKYPGFYTEFINLDDPRNRRMIIDLFVRWEKNAKKSRKDTENELTAITRLIDHHASLNVYALGIYHNTQLIAFNLYEITHGNFGISAFQKADKTFTGIYAYLSHASAHHLHSLGCTHINYEQDLGIEGLRLSKQLWKPVYYLKKYKLTPKKSAPSIPVTRKQQQQAHSKVHR